MIKKIIFAHLPPGEKEVKKGFSIVQTQGPLSYSFTKKIKIIRNNNFYQKFFVKFLQKMVLSFSICSFFSAARRTNQEAPPLLSGLLARPLLPPSGAAELASLRQSSPGFLCRQASSRPDKGGFPCRTRLPLFSLTPPACLTPPASPPPLYCFATQGRSEDSSRLSFLLNALSVFTANGNGDIFKLLLCVLRSKI